MAVTLYNLRLDLFCDNWLYGRNSGPLTHLLRPTHGRIVSNISQAANDSSQGERL